MICLYYFLFLVNNMLEEVLSYLDVSKKSGESLLKMNMFQSLIENNVLNSCEIEREKTLKQEMAEISRVPIDSNKTKFEVELRDKISQR